MEAKDTVMPTPDHSESVYCPSCGNEQGIEGLVRIIKEAQAEISFKAGIREVVEWVEEHEKSTCMDCLCAYDFRVDEWQAKLKEWGIDNA